MSEPGAPITTKVLELRRLFDESFARPPRAQVEDRESLLKIRVGDHPFALRLAELSGLEEHRKIVPIPSSSRQLAGVAGVRGRLVPVYALASILAGSAEKSERRWLALVNVKDQLVALAFAELEGYVQVASTAFRAGASGPQADRGFVRALVQIGDETRSVLDVDRVIAAIGQRADIASTGEIK